MCTKINALGGGSNNQLGPTHYFEVKTPAESFWKEMIPPSYEEAIDNNNGVENLQTSAEVAPSDAKESSFNTTSAPPYYEESTGFIILLAGSDRFTVNK